MYTEGLLGSLTRLRKARALRCSSYDVSGRNADSWTIQPGETRVLADIKGTGCIKHIWMTQSGGYRGVLLRMFWDDEKAPSVLCPLGDFFGLGYEIVNSYESLLFSASANPHVNNKHLNQAWGMQPNAFLRNGSSLHENNTGGYQTSYVHHLENPVHFRKEIKVTIEHGHGNHLCNEMASTAYWYQREPHLKFGILPLAKRLPLVREAAGAVRAVKPHTSRKIQLTSEMKKMKAAWQKKTKVRA